MSKKKIVPLGKPLDDDDAALDILALVTPEDIALAQADATARMTKRGRALLEAARAEVGDEDEQVTP
jgi:hypothetical protein